MPSKRDWTDHEDETIRTMRADGSPWNAIGRALKMARDTAKDRARELGIDVSRASNGRVYPTAQPVSLDHRGPMSAMHPVSWEAIETPIWRREEWD